MGLVDGGRLLIYLYIGRRTLITKSMEGGSSVCNVSLHMEKKLIIAKINRRRVIASWNKPLWPCIWVNFFWGGGLNLDCGCKGKYIFVWVTFLGV